MRLTTKVFSDWLQAEIDDNLYNEKFKLFYGRQPDMPDRCATITRFGPGKDRYEGAFEEIPFNIKTRGRSESLSDAENLALFLDKLINYRQNIMIDTIYVTSIWVSNEPGQLAMTDRASRYEFSADYIALASKDP